MEGESSVIAVVVTAVATLIGALGLPELYRQITKRKLIDSDQDCRSRIQAMEMRIKQITTGVDMLLIVIESEFKDSPMYSNVIAKVRLIIEEHETELDSTNGRNK